MALPITWTTQKAAVLSAARAAGATKIRVWSTTMCVHFSTTGARDTFKTALGSISHVTFRDQSHAGAYCEKVSPT